jgi:hypothetical protein
MSRFKKTWFKPIDTAALTALVADLLFEERIDTDRVVAMPIDGDDVDTARLVRKGAPR